jgi:amphi-Trp domain-containing protein
MDSKKISLEMSLSRQEAVKYLESLVEDLKGGAIALEQAERRLSLAVPENLDLEIEAKVKKGRAKFSIEFSFKDTTQVEQDLELNIRADQVQDVPAPEPQTVDLEAAKKAVQATAEAAQKATSPYAAGGRAVFPKKPAAGNSTASAQKKTTAKKTGKSS